MSVQAIYAAFDQYPSAKGAATHIFHMVDALQSRFGNINVYTIGNNEIPETYRNAGINYFQFDEIVPNYLRRAEQYVAWLKTQISDLQMVELAHFRDIWSGMAILDEPKIVNTVFEVNGLPSIELPYRYPNMSKGIISKLKELEYDCLIKSDKIICPSKIIRDNLMQYGIKTEHIEVITNGADLYNPLPKPLDLPDQYILYFGALQPWQGIDNLLKAFHQLRDFEELYLVMCSSQKGRFAKSYKKLAEKLAIDHRIIWYYQLDKQALSEIIQHAVLSVAPLKETGRNIKQGCSPLKIFESMANSTTVIASDIPAVREIIDDRINGRLVRPDRPAELARVIRLLLDNPEINAKMAVEGYLKIKNKYLWENIKAQLIHTYNAILET